MLAFPSIDFMVSLKYVLCVLSMFFGFFVAVLSVFYFVERYDDRLPIWVVAGVITAIILFVSTITVLVCALIIGGGELRPPFWVCWSGS